MAANAPAIGAAYGAPELKRLGQRHMSWALASAGALHLLIVSAWWLAEHLGDEAPPTRTVRDMKYSELGPPPSISAANAPAAIAIKLPTALVKPKLAIPVPVPDEEAPPEQTIPTQEEMAPVAKSLGESPIMKRCSGDPAFGKAIDRISGD